MKRRALATTAAMFRTPNRARFAGGALALVCAAGLRAQAPHEFHRENVLGTSMHLRVRADDRARAEAAELAALAEIERLAGILSGWEEGTEVRRLLAAGAGVASPDLAAVLEAALAWHRETEAAFHPGVAMLAHVWSDAEAAGERPPAEALAAAREALAAPPYALEATAAGTRVTFAIPELSLDGLAKGYVLDRVAAVLAAVEGCTLDWIDIGGDVLVGAAAQRVAVADPRQVGDNAPPLCTLDVAGRAVASSAGHRRGYDIGGAHLSHILDPRTALPVEGVLGATVVAARGIDADALATACSVLGATAALRLVNALHDTECLVLTADGTQHRSAGFDALVAAEGQAAAADAQLTLTFELQDPNASGEGRGGRGRGRRGRGGYRRPYVAAWIEDADGKSVRTLCLWVERLRWLRDLRRWSRHHADDDALIQAISQATRKPGVYDLVWDGLDEKGARCAAGDYTVFLEVSREHGTYQLMRHRFALGGAPFEQALEGNVEVRAATVRIGAPAATERGGR